MNKDDIWEWNSQEDTTTLPKWLETTVGIIGLIIVVPITFFAISPFFDDLVSSIVMGSILIIFGLAIWYRIKKDKEHGINNSRIHQEITLSSSGLRFKDGYKERAYSLSDIVFDSIEAKSETLNKSLSFTTKSSGHKVSLKFCNMTEDQLYQLVKRIRETEQC